MHCRLIYIVFISAVMLIHTAIAQDTYIGKNALDSNDTVDSYYNHVFYKVTKKGRKNIFKKAVTDHIVSNKGIQDFYDVSNIETKWLDTILRSENKWHKQLQKHEQDYRKSFQRQAGLKSGHNDLADRIENYKKNISKLSTFQNFSKF